MRIFNGIALCALLGFSQAWGYTNLGNNTFQSDGSASDTQAAIYAVTTGGLVRIPPGSYTWTNSVVITNGVNLIGSGSGYIAGDSTTSIAVGTGTKVFTTRLSTFNFTNNQNITAYFIADGANYRMAGTVTSFSGTTLSLNVTSAVGSGTKAAWVFVAPATTTITNAASAPTLAITQSTKTNQTISGIRFVMGTRSGNLIQTYGLKNGWPIMVHDCSFSVANTGNRGTLFGQNGALIFRTYWDQGFQSGGSGGNGNNDEGITFKFDGGQAWTNSDTLGMLDVGGTNNTYVEDSYFAGLYGQSMDFDDNCRCVVRHCTFNFSGLTSHGADTSTYGNRHAEVYANTWLFSDLGTDTFNQNQVSYLRGGILLFFSNSVPLLRSTYWGTKASLKFTVQNINRNGGPFPCWTTYPAPHQVGQGANGSTQILDPCYEWDNTGGGDYDTPDVATYSPDQCGNGLLSSTFIVQNRDYFTSTPKPSYTPYTYPHPLQTLASANNRPPVAVATASSTNGLAPLTVTFSSNGSFDPEGAVLTYNWTFGDGGTSTAANPAHTYTIAGNYFARLSVSDGTNATSSAVIQILVKPTPPTGLHILVSGP